MEIEIQVYLSNLKTFFKNNPTDLFDLIGNNDSEKFYDLIHKKSLENIKKGEGFELTKNQIIEIIHILNSNINNRTIDKSIIKGPLSNIFLN